MEPNIKTNSVIEIAGSGERLRAIKCLSQIMEGYSIFVAIESNEGSSEKRLAETTRNLSYISDLLQIAYEDTWLHSDGRNDDYIMAYLEDDPQQTVVALGQITAGYGQFLLAKAAENLHTPEEAAYNLDVLSSFMRHVVSYKRAED